MAKFTDAQVGAIIGGKRKFRTVPFPDCDDIKVAVRCLTESELDGCRIEAQQRLRTVCKQRQWGDASDLVDVDPGMLSRLIERQTVWRAFYDPATLEHEHPEHFFPSQDDVDQLTAEQIGALLELYFEHQEWVNPQRTLSEAGAKELADELGKPEGEAVLGSFDHDSLRNLCISLAFALRSKT